jgi:hypothetical protein
MSAPSELETAALLFYIHPCGAARGQGLHRRKLMQFLVTREGFHSSKR